jgi:hypothetical protein
MKSKDGFIQGYNAQAAVDRTAQIIVAHDVTQSAADSSQLVPMTDAIETNLGRKPEQLSADAGYCSEANLEALEARGIDAYVATGRARDAVAGADVTAAAEVVTGALEAVVATASPDEVEPPTRVETMRAKIKAGGHDSPYRFRKQLPEPVFGQIKEARGFRQLFCCAASRKCVRMGNHLLNPQPAETGPGAEAVRRNAANAGVRPGLPLTPAPAPYRSRCNQHPPR